MKNIHALASILTVVTVLLNISAALFGEYINIPSLEISFEIPNFFLKVIVFLYLELFISLFFAYFKFKLIFEVIDEIPYFYIVITLPIMVVFLTISAWTSLFNVEWLFLDKNWNYSLVWSVETFKLIFFSTISVGIMWISGGFIGSLLNGPREIIDHENPDIKRKEEFDEDNSTMFSWIIGIFIIIVIIYKFLD